MDTQAPPSYESVTARLPEKPTAQQIYDALELLSNNELHAIVTQAQNRSQLTEDEQKLLNAKIAEGIAKSSQDLKDTGKKVAQACININDMFDNLLNELVNVDAKNTPPPEGPFVPRVKAQQQTYRSLTHESSKLALTVAAYGARFDSAIIPLCKDDRLTKEVKLAKVNEYIKDAEMLEKDSKGLTDKFTAFKNAFKTFVGTFSSWAKSKLDSDNVRLAKLEAELKIMENTLESWGTAFTISKWVAGSGFIAMTLMGGLMVASGGAAALLVPIIGIIGVVAFVGGTLSTIICLIGRAVQTSRVNDKKEEIKKLKREIHELTQARLTLEKLGSDSLATLDANINILSGVWKFAQSDARKIKFYLETGKADLSNPTAFMSDMGNAVGTYQAIAGYLNQYADGIHTGSLPKGNPPAYKP